MDVLKDITDGLRSDGENAQDETKRAGETGTRGRNSPEATADPSDEESELESGGRDADESNEDDVHLCSFCETEFDAGRDTCPECDAKIVLRGAR